MHHPQFSILIGASSNEAILERVYDHFLTDAAGGELVVGCSDEARTSMSITSRYVTNGPGRIRLAEHADMPQGTADLNAARARARGDVIVMCSDPRDLSHIDVRGAIATMSAAGAAFVVWSWRDAVPEAPFTAIYRRLVAPRCILLTRALLDQLDPLDDTLQWHAVWDYQLRAASAAQGVIIVPGSGLHHEVERSQIETRLLEATGILRRFRDKRDCDPDTAMASLAAELEIEDDATLDFAAATAALPWHPPAAATLGARLVFILTLPRSGSTLLQRLPAQHPDLHSLPEPWIMLPLTRVFSNTVGAAAYDESLAHRAIESFLGAIGASDETLVKLIRNAADQLYRRALHGSGKSRFVDKTPRYYQIASLLAKLYPDARFIILARHPGAILSSMLGTWCEDDVNVLRNNIIYEDLTQGPAALVEAQRLLGSSAVTIRYEELVAEPEPVMRTLCTHLDLPWTERVLNYAPESWPSNGFGDEGRITLHSSAVAEYQHEWRARLASRREISAFADTCFELIGDETMTQLGYTKDGVERVAVPGSADQLTCEGESLYAQGRIEDASRAFKAALELDSTFVNAHNNLGVLHWQAGDLPAALECFTHALDNDPGNVNALVNLLEVLDATGRLSDALPSIDRYLHQHPEAREFADLRRTLLDASAAG